MVDTGPSLKKGRKPGLATPPPGTADYRNSGLWTDKATGRGIGWSTTEDAAIVPYTKRNKPRASKPLASIKPTSTWPTRWDLVQRGQVSYKAPKGAATEQAAEIARRRVKPRPMKAKK